MTTTTARPTDKQLLWREERDQHGNSTHEALSYTWGNPQNEPTLLWRVECVLKNNAAVWTVDETSHELLDCEQMRFLDADKLIFVTQEAAQEWCQSWENSIRMILGEGLPPVPEPEPESAPLIGDEHGFAPTTIVRSHWSKNGGRLRFTRVWRKVDGHIEQERDITGDEETECLKGYFTQRMIEETVTRLVTGGFGLLIWKTPFAEVTMQCELDFLNVSAFTATITRPGQPPEELKLEIPTTQRIMAVVARQMHERQKELDEKIGNRTEQDLRDEIQRLARQLGLPSSPPAPGVAESHSGILPVELGDIHAAGGDITNPGQLPREKRRPC